jgi:hypothetical protein
MLVAPAASRWLDWARQNEVATTFVQEESEHDPLQAELFFTSRVLLLGALMGIDMVRMLEGAVQASDDYRSGPQGHNIAWQYADVLERCQITDPGCRHVWVAGGRALESFAQWLQKSCARRLAPTEGGSRSARAMLGAEGLITWFQAVEARTDCAWVPPSEKTVLFPGCRSVGIRLPCVNEASMGQLIQSMMLAVATCSEWMKAETTGRRDLQP